jgi:hypothetical protein
LGKLYSPVESEESGLEDAEKRILAVIEEEKKLRGNFVK